MVIILLPQAVENAGSRLTEGEKSAVLRECNNQLRWLEGQSGGASVSDLEQHLKDAQSVCQPVMMKLHGAGGGGPSCARPPSPGGPRVTEID